MNFVARTILVSSLASVAACSGASSPATSGPAASYVGVYVFQSGTIELMCQGAPQPITYDLTNEGGSGHPGSFTNSATGDMTFHHKDINDCEFDFTVDGDTASTSGGKCTTIPDGRGGLATWVVGTMTFTPTANGQSISVQGDGVLGGCPMTVQGVASRQ